MEGAFSLNGTGNVSEESSLEEPCDGKAAVLAMRETDGCRNNFYGESVPRATGADSADILRVVKICNKVSYKVVI
jgi:hypothetical protein